ncbi:MAG TPA: spirocyclase AveC family protein, partial [Ramlibacter sp.]|nr:spirocyclase AveC family protein [Ramlibacter sp.]
VKTQRVDSFGTSRIEPIHWWAGIGALLLLLQIYIYGAWLMSDKFVPTDPGPDPLPGYSAIGLRIFEGVAVLALIGTVIYFVRTIWRDRTLAPIQLLMLGWLLTYWQDPWLNMLRPTFTYNAHLLNYGSWSEFIPGWLSPHGSRVPEPLLINLSAYVFQLPLSTLIGWWAMRRAKASFPQLGNFRLFLCALAAMMVVDLFSEILATRVVHYDAWPGAWGPKLWDGEFYQIPLYEMLFFPLALASCSALYFFRDDRGRMLVERGVDRVEGGNFKRNVLRVLAVATFANLANGVYIFIMAGMSLYSDPWPVMPSYLRNNVCGKGTAYECPGPDVPVFTKTSKGIAPYSGRN